ncbi:hypothetical protein AV530_000501 [Patagioenas fasciata monilis]|uniref:RRM domain-containing protein n=1 Tax=Patagioenas fasciata monilis TaxID=372326 RepID=A0A1V4IFP2_PATFA|nr:hypothetical protein AV530_000501 [Patagioenas fasciata monilis]
MSRYGRYGGETKVYVGNLGTGAGKGELERAFSYYGPLRTVWIARNPPGFAFVEFEDPRDAEDAVRGLDGKVICPEAEGILGHVVGVVVGGLGQPPTAGPGPFLLVDLDLDQDPDLDPDLLHGPEAGLGLMADQNLAHRLRVGQSPDHHLQREVVHHQEALKEVQVLKEWIEVMTLIF